MPIVQPTTPTSQGFAQAFDTSGLVQIAAAEREKKNKALQQAIADYDTKGAWRRDMPEIQRQIREVQDFAMKNAEAIANPSQNIETYQKFKDMQNKVKGTVTYSMAAKEQFDKGMQMYLSGNGRYMTDRNRDILYAYQNAPSREDYDTMVAWDDPSKYFDRMVPDGLMNGVVQQASRLVKDTPPEMGDQLAEGLYAVTKGKALDKNELAEAMLPLFNSKTVEGQDLRYLYGEGPEAEARFLDDVAAGVNTSPEYATARTAVRTEKEEKAKTARELAAENAVKLVDRSRHFTIEPIYAGGDAERNRPYQGANDKGKKSSVQNYQLGTAGGTNNTMMFAGDISVTKPITEGQDMVTGKMMDVGDGKKYKYQIPLERDRYLQAKSDFNFEYINEKGDKVRNVFKKGEAVPDFYRMYQDGKIGKNDYYNIADKIEDEDGYLVYASTEAIDYFDLAEGEDVMKIVKERGGRIIRVPAWTLSPEVDQQLLKKHGHDQNYYRGIQQQPEGQEPQQPAAQAGSDEDFTDI